MSKELKKLKKVHESLCKIANSEKVNLENKEHRRLQNSIMILHDNLNSLIADYNHSKFPSEKELDFLT